MSQDFLCLFHGTWGRKIGGTTHESFAKLGVFSYALLVLLQLMRRFALSAKLIEANLAGLKAGLEILEIMNEITDELVVPHNQDVRN